MKNLLTIFIFYICLPCSLQGFSVVTQNLWHYPNDYNIRVINLDSLLSNKTPDVIAFQETWKWLGGRSLFKKYLKTTEQNYSFCKTNNLVVMREGVAIASRYKFIEKSCIRLPYSKIRSKRYVNISVLEIENKKVLFVDVHLSPYSENKNERVAQISFVADLIESSYMNIPVVLLGDFNQEFDNGFFSKILNLGFKTAISPTENVCSYCGSNKYVKHNFSSKIDFIFYSAKYLKVKNSKIWGTESPISDHFGIWADLVLK